MLVEQAVPTSLRVLRRAVEQWLAAARWPEADVEDITLAVSEAVTNVIEHAYLDHEPGPVHLYAWITPGADRPSATIVVSDQGRWSTDRRTVDPKGHRGHGLALMRSLMAAVHVQRAASGTTVVLASRSVG